MQVKITGSTKIERQTQLYSLVVSELEAGRRIVMISDESWQNVITSMFSVPNFDANRLRAMQNDEFVLLSTQQDHSINISEYYSSYDVFVLDSLDVAYLNTIEGVISTIEASVNKTLILN